MLQNEASVLSLRLIWFPQFFRAVITIGVLDTDKLRNSSWCRRNSIESPFWSAFGPCEVPHWLHYWSLNGFIYSFFFNMNVSYPDHILLQNIVKCCFYAHKNRHICMLYVAKLLMMVVEICYGSDPYQTRIPLSDRLLDPLCGLLLTRSFLDYWIWTDGRSIDDQKSTIDWN